LNTRRLGRTDTWVPVIALGFWAVADASMWGPQDERDAIDAVHTALDLGMTLIDTAEAYGDGTSEELLGKALKGRRDEAFIASKVIPSDLAPDRLIASCEASLRRLDTDRIDLYQVHWPNHDIPIEDSLAAMEKLRDQGKIRFIGVSNFGPGDLNDLLAAGRAESNQVPYSLLFRAIEDQIVPLCIAHDIGILAYSPLLQGLLTGKFASVDEIPVERRRTRHFSTDQPMARHGEPGAEAEVFAALDAIRSVAESLDVTMAQLALAWVAHQPGVASVIAGARNPAQVRQNAAAADLRLSPQVVTALNRITEPVKARLGPNPDMWQAGDDSRYR
jgi:myo-inositol catabolism protein IolS